MTLLLISDVILFSSVWIRIVP